MSVTAFSTPPNSLVVVGLVTVAVSVVSGGEGLVLVGGEAVLHSGGGVSLVVDGAVIVSGGRVSVSVVVGGGVSVVVGVGVSVVVDVSSTFIMYGIIGIPLKCPLALST